MTKLDARIIAALAQANALTTEEIARNIDAAIQATQCALHQLDDDGHVRMRNGFYRLTEAAKAARRGEACEPPLPDCVVHGDDDYWMVDR